MRKISHATSAEEHSESQSWQQSQPAAKHKFTMRAHDARTKCKASEHKQKKNEKKAQQWPATPENSRQSRKAQLSVDISLDI